MDDWIPEDLEPEEALDQGNEVQETIDSSGFKILERIMRYQAKSAYRKAAAPDPNLSIASSNRGAGIENWFDQIAEIKRTRDEAERILSEREDT